MKLLHVIASMDPRGGGPCQGIRNLAPQVLAHGDSVEVVCLDDQQADYLAHENVCVHALGKGRGPWSYHPALVPWLNKNLPRFDAVILNGLWQYHGYALAKTSQQQSGLPPYFIFPHGMLDPWFQRAPERRLKAIRNWCYWKLIEQRVIRRAGALFFTCAEELQLARKTFRPYQPQREINIGYGVAGPPEYHTRMTNAFAEKCPDVKKRPYLLFLSRIHPKKGIDLLLRAYAKVYGSRTKDSKPPLLVIAGPGLETQYGQQMQRLAAELCPPNSVHWPGMLTGDAKWGSLYGCEVFVLPSHQENFGIAVVEALACGKPVLISDQVNIWREINEDHAGLINPDTSEGAEQLLRSWENLSPEAKRTMGQAGKSCYANRFSVVTSGKNFIATIEDLTKQIREMTKTSANGNKFPG